MSIRTGKARGKITFLYPNGKVNVVRRTDIVAIETEPSMRWIGITQRFTKFLVNVQPGEADQFEAIKRSIIEEDGDIVWEYVYDTPDTISHWRRTPD